MSKKPKSEAEKLSEMARQPAWTDAALARAVLRLARKDAAIGQLLIAEVLRVEADPKRMVELENGAGWFDMGGASALVIVESLKHEIRAGENERQKHLLAAVAPELIRHEVECVATRALKIITEMQERSRQVDDLARLNQGALEKLALLLG